MKRTIRQWAGLTIASALLSSAFVAKADEGMWLLPLLQQQNHAKMKEMGLRLSADEIYNNHGQPMLMDAVVHFGGGCTGVVVSEEGLIFTNHHCRYDEIQYHSSVANNYLKYGFFAQKLQDELPAHDTDITFIDEIVEVTDYIQQYLKEHKYTDPMHYLSSTVRREMASEWYHTERGTPAPWIEVELAQMYEGNRYYIYVKKVYKDVRLVAAPPSCVGSYGSDTDNWTWPRHSGDFSVFRVYTAPNGDPAPYSPDNVPLKPKKHMTIDARGVQPDDFVMVIGFPGSTRHFFTSPEVQEFRQIDNQLRVDMRSIRQEAMLQEMQSDEAINIQYAAKYQGSTNAYKRAIGSSWAIDNQDIALVKQVMSNKLERYATAHNKPEYISAIRAIKASVQERMPLRRAQMLLDEGLIRGSEIVNIPILSEAQYTELQQSPYKLDKWLEERYSAFFNKDYNADVDRKVTKAMIAAYKERDQYSGIFDNITDVPLYVDLLFDQSVYLSRSGLRSFVLQHSYDDYLSDPAVMLAIAVKATRANIAEELRSHTATYQAARQTYLRGLLEMDGELSMWPDANSTIRYTYGQVKGYTPRDQVYYGAQTTMTGMMEKYKPGDYEYDLLQEIRDIYINRDFGGLNTLSSGEMPVDFCATTHTTGGNSGSPVFNGDGYLVGLNFDRNWEGVGGDINYLPNYQRSIICDARYILLMLDKYLHAQRLMDELDIIR